MSSDTLLTAPCQQSKADPSSVTAYCHEHLPSELERNCIHSILFENFVWMTDFCLRLYCMSTLYFDLYLNIYIS